ncbi:MAG: hypothetical protein Q9169_000635 [Polycauliona sp. 2 TL-2023]
MASGYLSIEDFFTRLSSLFQTRRNSTHGSIYLTQKRLSPQSPSAASSPPTETTTDPPFADQALSSPLPILIRASNGKSKKVRKDKIKLSTIVQPDQLEPFFIKYAEILKSGAAALKKRDRSGRKKATKAKKKGRSGGVADGAGGEKS